MKKLLGMLSLCLLASCSTIEDKKIIDKELEKTEVNLLKNYEISYENVKISEIKITDSTVCKESGITGIEKELDCTSKVTIEIINKKSVPTECNIVTNSRVIMLEKEVIFNYKRDLILKSNESVDDLTVTCI